MNRRYRRSLLLAMLAVLVAGCGVFYDASAHIRTSRMAHTLKAGETTLEVHKDWGEPDLRTTVDSNSEIWSYVSIPNSNDAAAILLYTSTKPGDTDKFLDLKFADNKLVSWTAAEHTMPAKKGSGFNYGFGGVGGSSPVSHY
jgi:hypothetical protein